MKELETCRREIDDIDRQLLQLFTQRMRVSEEVAAYKVAHNLPILNAQREEQVIQNKLASAEEDLKLYTESFFINLMETSKCHQINQTKPAFAPPFAKEPLDLSCAKIGCYSKDAALQSALLKTYPDCQVYLSSEMKPLLDGVLAGDFTAALLPFENTTEGSMDWVYEQMSWIPLYVNQVWKVGQQRCILISDKLLTSPACNTISICIKLPDVRSALNRLLTKYSIYGVNLTKIRSCPDISSPGEMVFHIDFAGNFAQEPIQRLFNDLSYNYADIRITGIFEG